MKIAIVPFGQVDRKVLEHLEAALRETFGTVSYTHLTLPTNREV